jgi:hypothetical protein
MLASSSVGDAEWESGPDQVFLGVDVVELVSSAMYFDPLAAYREYVQNAADAIDDAHSSGILPLDAYGRIEFIIDPAARSVRICDNGTGVTGTEFLRRLTAFGGSDKRGKERRGFRGVGRLAALGYCQELVFRSRTSADEPISELLWDCRLLRTILRSGDYSGTLHEAIRRVTAYRVHRTPGYQPRFFEVELRSVVRHGNDDLLNESVIRGYLSEVAPVSFDRSFQYREDIEAFLGNGLVSTNLHIFVNGVGPLQRPHRDTISISEGVDSKAAEIMFVTIPAVDGNVAAKGWILHHDYLGAISRDVGVRGLRLRSGNIQIGDASILDRSFREQRFNSWAIGEFHIVDRRITPNGRRDQYEQNVHFANVVNHIVPCARDISSRCRSRSQYRQLIRKVNVFVSKVEGGLAIFRQGAISARARCALVEDLDFTIRKLGIITQNPLLSVRDCEAIDHRQRVLRTRLTRMVSRAPVAAKLRRFSAQRRHVYEEVFALLYECAGDVNQTKELIDRILARL